MSALASSSSVPFRFRAINRVSLFSPSPNNQYCLVVLQEVLNQENTVVKSTFKSPNMIYEAEYSQPMAFFVDITLNSVFYRQVLPCEIADAEWTVYSDECVLLPVSRFQFPCPPSGPIDSQIFYKFSINSKKFHPIHSFVHTIRPFTHISVASGIETSKIFRDPMFSNNNQSPRSSPVIYFPSNYLFSRNPIIKILTRPASSYLSLPLATYIKQLQSHSAASNSQKTPEKQRNNEVDTFALLTEKSPTSFFTHRLGLV